MGESLSAPELETAAFYFSQPHNIRLAAKRGKRSSFSLFLESLTLLGEGQGKGNSRTTGSVGTLSDFCPEGTKGLSPGFQPRKHVHTTTRPEGAEENQFNTYRSSNVTPCFCTSVFVSPIAIQTSDSTSRLAATIFCPFPPSSHIPGTTADRQNRSLFAWYPGVKTPG